MMYLLAITGLIVNVIILFYVAEALKIVFKNTAEKAISSLSKKRPFRIIAIGTIIFFLEAYFIVPRLKSYLEDNIPGSAETQKDYNQDPVMKPGDNGSPFFDDTIKPPGEKIDTSIHVPPLIPKDTIQRILKVRYETVSDFEVHNGDTLLISASGTIDQDRNLYQDFGVDSLIMSQNIPLSSYGPNGLKNVSSFVKVSWRHDYGALLVSVGDDSLRFCGKHLRFIANADGSVRFLINSQKRRFRQDDQYFAVDILVSKRK
jgi:hypothetical protein